MIILNYNLTSVCVFVLKLWDSLYSQKLGGIFFNFSKMFPFLGPLGPVFPKTLRQPKEVKNCPIMLKFYTIVDRRNTWGC